MMHIEIGADPELRAKIKHLIMSHIIAKYMQSLIAQGGIHAHRCD